MSEPQPITSRHLAHSLSVATPYSPSRPVRQIRLPAPEAKTLGASLLRDGLISPHALVQALAMQKRHRGRLADILLSRQAIDESVLYKAHARHWKARLADPLAQPPDPALIDRLGAAVCLREGLLPLRRAGGLVIVATAHPEEFSRHHHLLTQRLGPVVMAVAPATQIEAAVLKARGPALIHHAQNRVDASESCRDWGKRGLTLPLTAASALLFLALWLTPAGVALTFWAWTALTLLLVTILRSAALFGALTQPPRQPGATTIARLPTVSVMVALFGEDNIAPRLISRLSLLDYPRDLLDILLVVEETDRLTRDALAQVSLPPWMRIVVVPDGPLKTKPRALNFALDLCRGSIIGVYDAEDAPEPAQIRKVVDRFYNSGPDVACLQGILDFYNPRTNWLSRCFTMEYAAWFRMLLPGMQRLGLAIPLGGTTLFFRRAVLEELGAWDAHNVTEDADLGIRLARHGYRTELLETVTAEEANCRALPWVRQRSRWLKGYMMTYAVHMRRPGLLWRQLGPKKFIGFQVLFLGTLSQFLLAPVLWTFWALPLGLPHPLASTLSDTAMFAMLALFIATEATNLTATYMAMRRTAHRMNPLWIPMLHLYFPLGALASYKAAWEMITRPFYWDKTSHGHFDETEPGP